MMVDLLFQPFTADWIENKRGENARVAYNVLLECVSYLFGLGANAEQLFLMLFWVQRMSQEVLGEDTGFRSVWGLLWLNA